MGRRAECGHDVTTVGAAMGGKGRSPRRSGARRAGPFPSWIDLARAPGGRQTSSARCCQRTTRSAKGAAGALGGRVAAQAVRAPRPPCTPRSSMWRRMSAPRDEKAPSNSGPTPATSDPRPGAPVQRTPSAAVSPARRWASYTAEAATRCASIPRRSQALQRPSAAWTRFASTTWLWTWGSPLRLIPCVNTAATAPLVGSTSRRGPARRVAVSACSSRYESEPATAPVCAAKTVRAVSAPASANSTLADFGALEGEIERRHGDPSRTQLDSRPGMAALEHPAEVVRLDGAAQSEPLGRAPGPPARAGHGQLESGVRQVVLGLGPPDPVDPQHGGLPSPDALARVNGRTRTAVSSGAAPRPGSPGSSTSRSRRNRAGPPPERRTGGPAPVPR